MSQVYAKRQGGNDDDDTPEDSGSAAQERVAKTVSDTETLLDEIDEVLEQNAAEFVQEYVQMGGQ